MAFSYVKPRCSNCEVTANNPDEDFQWFEDRNLDLSVACRDCVPHFELTLTDAKWLQEKRLGLLLICKDCFEPFLVSPDELSWLMENDLKLFRRCPACRAINKQKKLESETADLLLNQEMAATDE